MHNHKYVKKFNLGQQEIILESNEIAKQADGSVIVKVGDTVLLATVVASKNVNPGQDFFPLTVDYLEKSYAAGKIPGGYIKRETKPSDNEILVSRLIDRPIRPLFPNGFFNEVQILVQVLSVDPNVQADIAAILGASAALALSGIPFYGPLGAARVGYIDGQYILNPTNEQRANTELDLVVAGNQNAVLMVEAQANNLSEEVVLGAINYGHEQMQIAINAIKEFALEAGKPEWEWNATVANVDLTAKVSNLVQQKLVDAYNIIEKQQRSKTIKSIYAEVEQYFSSNSTPENIIDTTQLQQILFDVEAKIVRSKILNGEPRIDGRDTRTVRQISIRNQVLPRTHGSALFTRGETQALVVTTLGTRHDEQIVDSIYGESRERFLLHYNMPPFATGELGRIGTPKRREIGHGRLALKALEMVLPTAQEFPYTIRLVSEITESNGSSSMASVCGGCLSLLDAGVPLKNHVAGVAMGLIIEQDKFAVLTDILGDEDHLGDMDFKVAGTTLGITALQMDIKVQGITSDIMKIALAQAKEGRLHILNIMQQEISGYRSDLSEYAPKLVKITINPDKIRDLIGKGGSNIQALTKETNTKIDITEDGEITISSNDMQSIEEAKKRILASTLDIQTGKIYTGTVMQILDFGAVIELVEGTGKTGLLHISEISKDRIRNIRIYLGEGQKVNVRVVQKDEDKNKIRLTMKDVEQPESLREYMQSQLDQSAVASEDVVQMAAEEQQ